MRHQAQHHFAADGARRHDAARAHTAGCWRVVGVGVRVDVLGMLSTITVKPSAAPGGLSQEGTL